MDEHTWFSVYLFFMLSTAALNVYQLTQKKKRRWWVRPINRTRSKEGHFNTIFAYMKAHDHEEFSEFVRMLPEKFDQLVELVSPFLPNPRYCIRKCLPADLRLAVTLSSVLHIYCKLLS